MGGGPLTPLAPLLLSPFSLPPSVVVPGGASSFSSGFPVDGRRGRRQSKKSFLISDILDDVTRDVIVEGEDRLPFTSFATSSSPSFSMNPATGLTSWNRGNRGGEEDEVKEVEEVEEEEEIEVDDVVRVPSVNSVCPLGQLLRMTSEAAYDGTNYFGNGQ